MGRARIRGLCLHSSSKEARCGAVGGKEYQHRWPLLVSIRVFSTSALYLPHIGTPISSPVPPIYPTAQDNTGRAEAEVSSLLRSPGSPGRVEHLVPAWWQALQPSGLIIYRIIIIVLSNDLFLWFWQNKEVSS